jgi:hypothetical protein
MGFIAGCLLLAVITKTGWDFVRNPAERKGVVDGLLAKPMSSIFLIVWLTFFLMFFFGMFIPSLGETELGGTGWTVWQAGFFGFFGMWVITFFVKLEDMDKQ